MGAECNLLEQTNANGGSQSAFESSLLGKGQIVGEAFDFLTLTTERKNGADGTEDFLGHSARFAVSLQLFFRCGRLHLAYQTQGEDH